MGSFSLFCKRLVAGVLGLSTGLRVGGEVSLGAVLLGVRLLQGGRVQAGPAFLAFYCL